MQVAHAASGCYEAISFKIPLFWKIGFEAQSFGERLTEYVPRGQTVHNWTELVTIQAFDMANPDDFSPRELMNELMASLKTKCANRLRWRVMHTRGNRVVYEWGIRSCEPYADQNEVVLIAQGEHTMFRVAYTRRGSDLMPSAERTVWRRRFLEANIVRRR